MAFGACKHCGLSIVSILPIHRKKYTAIYSGVIFSWIRCICPRVLSYFEFLFGMFLVSFCWHLCFSLFLDISCIFSIRCSQLNFLESPLQSLWIKSWNDVHVPDDKNGQLTSVICSFYARTYYFLIDSFQSFETKMSNLLTPFFQTFK